MPRRDPTHQDPRLVARERLERTKAWLLMVGCGGVVGGVLAVAEPLAGATAFAMVCGLLLAVGGVFQFLRGLLFHRWRPTEIVFRLISGTTSSVIGAALLVEPHAAVAALGLALSVLVIGHGCARALEMLHQADNRWWLWAAVAGTLTLILVGVFLFGWPRPAVLAFGAVGGLTLVALGGWLILLATATVSGAGHKLVRRRIH